MKRTIDNFISSDSKLKRTIDTFFRKVPKSSNSFSSGPGLKTAEKLPEPQCSASSGPGLKTAEKLPEPQCSASSGPGLKTAEKLPEPQCSASSGPEPKRLKICEVNVLAVPDIGAVAQGLLKKEISCTDELKTKVLSDDLFVPGQTFVYPVRVIHGMKRTFQVNWLRRWNWLAYSRVDDGAYCKFCVVFAAELTGKGNHQKLGQLVTFPFIKWKDAVEKFDTHSKTNYHKEAAIKAENFMNIEKKRQEDIAGLIDNQRIKEKEENRAALRPVVETIIFCGQHELPLRGDNDSGPLSLEDPNNKDGKFRALLRFRAKAGDNVLKNHIQTCRKNASYFSPLIQNEVLKTCGELIQRKIVSEINQSQYFTILGDETLDVSGTEQFSLCIRFVSPSNCVREDFLCFVPIYDMTGEAVTETILNTCECLGLNMNNLVGLGFDGAANMGGHISGVQARIRQKYPRAVYVHCASHRLNLALSSGLSIPCVRNSFGVMRDTCSLFQNNSLAVKMLRDTIDALMPEEKKRRLVSLCDTRFIERHDAVIVFLQLLEPIVACLRDLSDRNRAVSSTAAQLLSAIEKSQFIVSLLVCEEIFSHTLPLSMYLQNPSHDLAAAVEYAENVIQVLKELREKSDRKFGELFTAANNFMKNLFGTSVEVPRICSKQTKRSNYPHESAEVYFRRSVWIPCLDGVISALDEKFSNNKEFLSNISVILPKNASLQKMGQLKNIVQYVGEGTTFSELKGEYALWCQKWSGKEQPSDLISVLDACDPAFFRGIHALLRVLATIPISTASVERSFSTMKRIKTFLRNRMGSNRLTGLALLSVHWRSAPTPDEVLDAMARQGPRKMLL